MKILIEFLLFSFIVVVLCAAFPYVAIPALIVLVPCLLLFTLVKVAARR